MGTQTQDQALNQLARGAGVSLAGKIGGRLIHLAGQVLFARLLGPESFGLYALGFTVLRMTALLAPLGIPRAAIYFGARYWRKDGAAFRGLVTQAAALTSASALTGGAILYFSAPWLSTNLFSKPELLRVLSCFAFALPLLTLLRLASDLTRVSRRMQFSVYAQDLLQPSAALVFFLVLYAVGYRLDGALAATVASFICALLLACVFVLRLFPELFSKTPEPKFFAGEMLRYSLPATLGGIFTMFIVWFDRLFVGHFLSAADVGVYQAASQSSIIFAIILASFRSIVAPIAAGLHADGDSEGLGEIYRVSTRWGLYLSIPLMLVIAKVPGPIMSLVFGTDYSAAALPFVLLSLGQFVNMAAGNADLLLIMTGHERRWFVLSGTMLLVNIALCWILVPRFALTGAACATSLTIVVLFSMAALQVRRTLSLWPYDRSYAKGAVAAVCAAAAMWGADFVFPGLTGGQRLLSALLLAPTVFFGILAMIGIEEEDRVMLRSVLRKVRYQFQG